MDDNCNPKSPDQNTLNRIRAEEKAIRDFQNQTENERTNSDVRTGGSGGGIGGGFGVDPNSDSSGSNERGNGIGTGGTGTGTGGTVTGTGGTGTGGTGTGTGGTGTGGTGTGTGGTGTGTGTGGTGTGGTGTGTGTGTGGTGTGTGTGGTGTGTGGTGTGTGGTGTGTGTGGTGTGGTGTGTGTGGTGGGGTGGGGTGGGGTGGGGTGGGGTGGGGTGGGGTGGGGTGGTGEGPGGSLGNNRDRRSSNRTTRTGVNQSRTSLKNYKKQLFTKKERARKCKPLDILKAALRQRLCRCPCCSPLNVVVGKVAGKNYFKIPFTNLKVPRFDHLFGFTATFDANRRKGEKCGACGGAKTLTDVHDDTGKYEQAAVMMDQKSQEILDAESKLGLGGSRTTMIQGSDMLFVGLGFNNNRSYEVINDGAIAPSMKGGKIPQQNATKVNTVVGKQSSLAWPQQVGNYAIKCANKFSVLAGAGGITIATPGPLTISAGMLKIVGPQLSLGSSSGPLSLEGDSVNLTGRAVSITPTGGELFVKGNISNTGNITTQGHAHFESVSFVRAAAIATNKTTFPANANPDNTCTQSATWTAKTIGSQVLDLKTFFLNVVTDSNTSAFRLLSPKEILNLTDRMSFLAKSCIPIEIMPTGLILPGMCNVFGIGNLGYPVFSTNLMPIPIWNFPHSHGLPEMMHNHEVTLPDMDYTSSTPQALRSKVLTGAHESGVPSDPTKDTSSRLLQAARVSIEFAGGLVVEGTKLVAKIMRLLP
jgi:hypothetical protein